MAEEKKIIVVDDDPIAGDLTAFILKEAGYEIELISDSRLALAAVRKQRPILVVLDVLMPGPNGMSICRQIKSDPELRFIKVVMVSGKNFTGDREKAMKSGAEAFIPKPYDVATFAASIWEVLARPTSSLIEPALDAPRSPPAPPPVAEVTVWGCRSRRDPPIGSSQYGIRTSCVSVKVGESLFVFDAGSGIVSLGRELRSQNQPRKLHIFLSHLHQDHTEGLSDFSCAFTAGYKLQIGGPNPEGSGLETTLGRAFGDGSASGSILAEIEASELSEGRYEIEPGIWLTALNVSHPDALGFSLEASGIKIVYCPDNEIDAEGPSPALVGLCSGADLLIHDARYTQEDYPSHRGQGHSSWTAAVELAVGCNAGQLLLFHHDDGYDDELLDKIGGQAQALILKKGRNLPCQMAREGLKLRV